MSDYKDYGFSNHQVSHVYAYIGRQLVKMLDHSQNQAILDMGCGNGALVEILLNDQYNAYGADASETGIRLASERHPGRFVKMNFSDPVLPQLLLSQKFDTVISIEVIEHLYDPRKFIRLCRSLLPAGGQLILSTPYHGYLKNLLIALTGKTDRHMDPLWDGGHIKFWTNRKLVQLLEEQGFNVVKFVGCGRFPYLWKSMLIKATLPDA